MRTTRLRLAPLTCVAAILLSAAPVGAIDRQQVLSASKIEGGVVVHLGCRNASLLAEFARDARFVAQGLTSDVRVVARMRTTLADKKLAGKASIRAFSDKRLPYIDNLIRFLVVEDSLGVADAELDRVLCPKSTRATTATYSFDGDARLHGLAIANGRVLVATEDGRLLCFDEALKKTRVRPTIE